MEKKSPYPWVSQIKDTLLEFDEIPLLTSSFAFDFSSFSEAVKERWEISSVHIKLRKTTWLSLEEIEKGWKGKVSIFPLSASPIQGELFWMMGEGDIAKLTSWLLSKGKEKAPPLSSEILQESFYHYLLLEALDLLRGMPYFDQFSFKIHKEISSLQEDGLCFDLQIELPQGSLWGRLVMPPTFRKSWKEYFTQINPHPFSLNVAEKLELPIGLKIGNVLLQKTDLKKIHPGDFLLLDQVTYDPVTHLGSAILSLHNLALFQVNIKERSCEIADLISYQEAQNTMENQKKPHKNAHAVLEDSQETENPSHISDMPFPVTVEIARLRMTLANLMKLEPGNFLELPKQPEEGVFLSINGKKIGRAELVYLGEALGIRILEWGA